MPRRIAFSSPRERAVSGLVTLGVAALVGWGLVAGLTVHGRAVVTEALESFAVLPPAPPPKPVPPPPQRPAEHRARRAPAPPNLHADPTEIVAPPPVIAVPPPPVIAAPIASTGAAPSAGAADVAGSGTGAGGEGDGLGGGGDGGGTGVRQVSRDLRIGDLPGNMLPEGFHRTVYFTFTVTADGHVRNCRIDHSSGAPEVDRATCAAAEQHLRFSPARDRAGRRIAVTVQGEQQWDNERREDIDDDDR